MIYLKIDKNKGFYRVDGNKDEWIELDQISKEHLLLLLEFAVKEGFEMDEYDDELLQNPAHNIIYKNIYRKFVELLDDKERFQDSSVDMYKLALEKYKVEE